MDAFRVWRSAFSARHSAFSNIRTGNWFSAARREQEKQSLEAKSWANNQNKCGFHFGISLAVCSLMSDCQCWTYLLHLPPSLSDCSDGWTVGRMDGCVYRSNHKIPPMMCCVCPPLHRRTKYSKSSCNIGKTLALRSLWREAGCWKLGLEGTQVGHRQCQTISNVIRYCGGDRNICICGILARTMDQQQHELSTG